MRSLLTVGFAVLLLAGMAKGEYMLSLRQESCPVAGMSRYVVTVSSGTTEPVYGVFNLAITGEVHQVWDFDGRASPQIDSLSPSRPADWFDADTCLLIVDDSMGDQGWWVETNDGAMGGSGLSLFMDALSPVTGMGDGFDGVNSPHESLDPAQRSPTVDFMQVVIPTDAVVYMDVMFDDGSWIGMPPAFYDYPIPEPATLSLLALGGAMLVRRRPR